MPEMPIHQTVRAHRVALGYTQEQVADELGMHRTTYVTFESGNGRRLLAEEMRVIARMFGMSLDELAKMPKRKHAA